MGYDGSPYAREELGGLPIGSRPAWLIEAFVRILNGSIEKPSVIRDLVGQGGAST